MTEQTPVMSQSEASKAVAKFKPTKVELSDGTTVEVGKISWMDFEGIWQDIAGIVAAYIMSNHEESTAAEVVAHVTAQTMKIPGIVAKIILITCPSLDKEKLGAMQFTDPVKLVGAAMRINVTDMKGVAGFLPDVMSALHQERPAKESNQTT